MLNSLINSFTMKQTLVTISALIMLMLAFSCGSSSQKETKEPAESEDLTSFITAPEYGWKQADKDYFLAFMADGRVAIEGDQGEASLWEGSWSLDGTTLTIQSDEFGKQVYAVKKNGDALFLNDDKFVKYTIE